jgi:hypothetical protein
MFNCLVHTAPEPGAGRTKQSVRGRPDHGRQGRSHNGPGATFPTVDPSVKTGWVQQTKMVMVTVYGSGSILLGIFIFVPDSIRSRPSLIILGHV